MATRLGSEIKRQQVRMGLSQAELARQAGVTRAWVVAVERGGIAQPDPEKLRRLASVLGLELRSLLALSDQLGAALEPAPPAPTGDLSAVLGRLADIAERQLEETRALREIQAQQTAALQALILRTEDREDASEERGREISLMLGFLTSRVIPEGTLPELLRALRGEPASDEVPDPERAGRS